MSVLSIKTIRNLHKKVLSFFVRRRFRERAILVGNNHRFFSTARILLSWGAKKENVILYSNCDIFGSLISCGKGKIILHEWVHLGAHSVLNAVNLIEIGRDTTISYNVTIQDSNSHPINPEDRRYIWHTAHGSRERSNLYSANAPIIIGENVWIGQNARICKGVRIGDNAIVAACAVVTHNVPANSIVAGNPAKIVKENIDKTTISIFTNK